MYKIYGDVENRDYIILKPGEKLPEEYKDYPLFDKFDTQEQVEPLLNNYGIATRYTIYGNCNSKEFSIYCPGADIPGNDSIFSTIQVCDTLKEAEDLVVKWMSCPAIQYVRYVVYGNQMAEKDTIYKPRQNVFRNRGSNQPSTTKMIIPFRGGLIRLEIADL